MGWWRIFLYNKQNNKINVGDNFGSRDEARTWATGSTLNQTTQPENDSTLIFLNHLQRKKKQIDKTSTFA